MTNREYLYPNYLELQIGDKERLGRTILANTATVSGEKEILALLRPKSRQLAQEMRTVPHRIQFDKVTHGVCSELSTENVDKATGVEKRLHHDDNPMSARKNR